MWKAGPMWKVRYVKARNGQLAAAAGAAEDAAAAGAGVAGADETVLPLASRESVR